MADLRRDAEAIVRAGVAAADPADAVRRSLSIQDDLLRAADLPPVPLSPGGRILIVGAGKATAAMAAAAAETLGERFAAGTITIPEETDDAPLATLPSTIAVWRGGHPIPEMGGLAGAAEALALARSARREDVVLCLLSGGASSLWSAPAPGLTLDDLRVAGEALLRSGAPIEAVNTVRSHLSAIAGGRLAGAAEPATVITLAISDVVGAGVEAIGSGPTVPAAVRYDEALEVVGRYSVALPSRALNHLRSGVAGLLGELPDPARDQASGVAVILSVDDALRGAGEAAERLGYRVILPPGPVGGEARDMGARVAAEAGSVGRGEGPIAILRGGETTVTVRGSGKGGRNQELALAAAFGIEGTSGVVIASAGTDGRDGPTEAAGAIVDGGTLQRGRSAGLDATSALHANDSHAFLLASGDLLITGPTGTNVNDLVVTLISPLPGEGSG